MRGSPTGKDYKEYVGLNAPSFSAMRTHRNSLKSHHSDGAALLRNDGLFDISDVCVKDFPKGARQEPNIKVE